MWPAYNNYDSIRRYLLLEPVGHVRSVSQRQKTGLDRSGATKFYSSRHVVYDALHDMPGRHCLG